MNVISLFAVASAIGAAPVSMDDLLARGPLVLIQESGDQFGSATGIVQVAAPRSVVWNTLVDFEHHVDFIPKVARSDVLRRLGHTVDVAYEIEVPGINTSYRVRYTLDEPNKKIKVEWLDGDLADSTWSWRLEESPDGKGTRAFYHCALRNISAFVESFDDENHTMTMGINVGSVVVITKAIRKRAESIRGVATF